MEIVVALPPVFESILRVFPGAAGHGVLFAFGSVIYNPSGIVIPPELIAHEEVHGARQLAMEGGVDEWWAQYILSPVFRCDEELYAHRAEYAKVCEVVKDRNRRAKHLHHIASRLAGPLYGGVIPFVEARALIGSGVK